jgi:DNA-binding IclR family transcriptional regulator
MTLGAKAGAAPAAPTVSASNAAFSSRMPEKHRPPAIERSLAVLEAILGHQQAVGLPDLSAWLGLPRQTVHRLLVQLERAGLVLRDPSRERYSAGPRLSRLAFATLRSLNQSAPVRSILKELVEDIGETCNIGVLDSLEYVYLQRIECDWPLRLHMELGSRMDAHTVSGGKVLLANLDAGLRGRLLRSRRLRASTPRTLTRISDVEAELAKIRAQGYALNDQERTEGIVGAAVPVFDSKGVAAAAVGMQGPLPRLTLEICERHVPRMQQAADRIARVWFG